MKNHIGETKIAKNGMKMTIIAYRGWRDIDVEFEDGSIVYHKAIDNFRSGEIGNPNLNTIKNRFQNKYIGMTNIAKNGMKMEIIKYTNSGNVDVKFEDGYISKHVKLICFKTGKIGNPNRKNNYIGEEAMSVAGLKMKIIKYRNVSDVDIEFEDGQKVYKKTYSNFRKGKIGHPLFKINYNNCSDNYFGFSIKQAFTYKNTKYYFAINNLTGLETVMTLQEIYKMEG